MKYGKLISIRLNEDKYKDLEKLAEEKETSVGSLVRQALAKYLLDNR